MSHSFSEVLASQRGSSGSAICRLAINPLRQQRPVILDIFQEKAFRPFGNILLYKFRYVNIDHLSCYKNI